MGEYEIKVAELVKRIESISSHASEIEEKLEQVNEQMDAKTSGGEGESNSTYIKLKEALKAIKLDQDSMSLRIGMLSSELLQKRCVKAREAARTRRNKQKAKAAGAGLSKLKRDAEGDNGSDEDL